MKRLAALVLLVAAFAQAAEAPPAAADPAVEKRLMDLAEELRCLVCQNQSLADSNADLAVDLRNEVRSQIQAGKSDAEIRAWLTQRYGDFVLYRPPVKATTILLWVGPFVLLVGGLLGLLVALRRRRARVALPALTDEERARAEALLGAESGPPPA
ncbi:MAG TPA: cytochrome c-type biogenesis protein [Burkholderiales bacterium]